MFIYLSKKIAIPNAVKQRVVSWNTEQGWIACGGENGLLKVLKLEAADPRGGVAAPTNLTMNQTLEGHQGAVVVAAWNENYRKLTTSDENGLIIVWMLHKGMWFEEMINNRNKSVVRDMKWTADGQKVCIVYQDGAVIVGSVDGNRLWGKELKSHLRLVEWSPDARNILFVTLDGQVQIYDYHGNYISKMPLYADGPSANIIGIAWYDGVEVPDPTAPLLAVLFSNGIIQMMRHEHDEKRVLIDTGMRTKDIRWNCNGGVLAVTGSSAGTSEKGEPRDNHLVQFYTPFGQHMRTLKVPGTGINSISWEGTGLRIALAVDSFIYFANVRPDYKWGFFSDTVVYAFNKPDRAEHCTIFWNSKTDEKHTKYVKKLLAIRACGDTCVLATKADDNSGQYILILCNAIGSPMDSKYIDVEPVYLHMTSQHVIVASNEVVYVWQYRTGGPKMLSADSAAMAQLRRKDGREKMWHIDDVPAMVAGGLERIQSHEATTDAICALCGSEKLMMVARESGTIHVFSLPHVAREGKIVVNCRPQMISLNCKSSKMAVIDIHGAMSLWGVDNTSDGNQGNTSIERLQFERKDAWDILWSDDEPDMFAVLEKARMYIFRGVNPEEPITSSAYLCKFSDLNITAVQLDEIIKDPEHPSREFVVDHETRSLRDSRAIIQENISIHECYQYVEDNPHPRLWRLVAEAALEKLDFQVADKAFVQCSDYQGIQFVKRLRILNNKELQRAEVETYFKRFEEAEKTYREIDRMDLALEMRKRLGDWFRVVQLVQQGYGDDNDNILALNNIGDYYADRQKWGKAVQYYTQAKNAARRVECYYMLEDFTNLEKLILQLNEGNALLKVIGEKFTSVGMVAEAVDAYIRAGDPRLAIDACASLNEWDRAIELAENYDLPHIEELLSKYATHLLEKGEKFEAMMLYRKANKHADAARLLVEMARKESESKVNPLRVKKLYVLAALEMDKLRSKMLGGGHNTGTQGTLDNLLSLDRQLGKGSANLDIGWRGAETFHFFLLAQRQLFEGDVEAALVTALRLRGYEDILSAEQIESVIALPAFYSEAYGQCSKAFIKLESLDGPKKAAFEDLAMTIFVRHPPQDSPGQEWLEAGSRQEIGACVVTGKPITEEQNTRGNVAKCNTCGHMALAEFWRGCRHCPLCHSTIHASARHEAPSFGY